MAGRDASADWLRGGAQDAELIRAIVERHGPPMAQANGILDFGCGCGRVARWWQELGATVFASDYDAEMTAWCRAHLPTLTVETNAAVPPLRWPADSFDLVYAISLFTHLTAAAQHSWMVEMSRVLRPGGLLLFTVHGQIFTNHLTAAQRAAFAQGEVVVVNPEVSGAQPCASYNPAHDVQERLLPAAGLGLVEALPGDWAHDRVWTAMVLQDKYLARLPSQTAD